MASKSLSHLRNEIVISEGTFRIRASSQLYDGIVNRGVFLAGGRFADEHCAPIASAGAAPPVPIEQSSGIAAGPLCDRARPWIIFCPMHDLRTHRIEFHVGD